MNDLAIRDRLQSGLGVTLRYVQERLKCNRKEAVAHLRKAGCESGHSGVWKIGTGKLTAWNGKA